MELLKMTHMLPTYFWEKWTKKTLQPEDEEDIEGKIILITGGDGGLGREAVAELAQRGAKIIMACLKISDGEAAVKYIRSKTMRGELILHELDLSKLDSIRNFTREIIGQYPHLNMLINNAGLFFSQKMLRKIGDSGVEVHFGVNYLGHFLLTNLLLDHLKKGAPSRILFTSSTMHLLAKFSLDDLMLEKLPSKDLGGIGEVPYANSKLSLMLFSSQLAEKLEGSGVRTFCYCPGLVNTPLFVNCTKGTQAVAKFMMLSGGQSPQKACEMMVYCAVCKSISQDSGKMYRFNRSWEVINQSILDKKEMGQKLWTISEDLVGGIQI